MDLAHLPARDRILATAHELFYRDGIRATGVDRIIAEAGVAKLTFYRHFPGKDDLVRAFLEHRHQVWMAWFVDALGRHSANAAESLQPLVAAMAEWFADPRFRGCAFINAMAEVGGTLADAAEIALRHKQDMQDVIEALLPVTPHRRRRAQAVALAVDGAIVRAQMHGAAAALDGLQLLAAELVD